MPILLGQSLGGSNDNSRNLPGRCLAIKGFAATICEVIRAQKFYNAAPFDPGGLIT